MKNILIVEDDALQAEGLKILLKNYNSNFNIFIASNSQEASNMYIDNVIDLFILDVDLSLTNSNLSGINIGTTIRNYQQYCNTPILYVTGVSEAMGKAINNVHCFSYISKPYDQESITNALDDVIRSSNSSSIDNNFISICTLDDIYISIKYNDIKYIDSLGHKITFHTTNGNFITRSTTLKDMTPMLPNFFSRVHKSYVANTHYINSYEKNKRLINIDNTSLPVGRNYKEKFENIYIKGD